MDETGRESPYTPNEPDNTRQTTLEDIGSASSVGQQQRHTPIDCPFCGETVGQLPGHLPCSGVSNGDTDDLEGGETA